MGYVALKSIDMKDHVRRAGEPIPEAAAWPHLNSWVKRGFVTYVPDGCEAQFAAELRRGNIPLALAPVAKPYHLTAAARLLSYGTAPVAQGSVPSPPAAAGAVPPIAAEPVVSRADTLFSEPATPPEAPAPKRKKG